MNYNYLTIMHHVLNHLTQQANSQQS